MYTGRGWGPARFANLMRRPAESLHGSHGRLGIQGVRSPSQFPMEISGPTEPEPSLAMLINICITVKVFLEVTSRSSM